MFTLSERKHCYIKMTNRILGLLWYRVKKYLGCFLKAFLYVIYFLTVFTDVVYALAGSPGGDGGAEPQGIGALASSFLPLILIFVIFYFLLIRPQSRKAKEHKQMLENLKKGDKIITTGGIYGIIEDFDANTITLKVGIKDDVRIKVGRSYIAGIRSGE